MRSVCGWEEYSFALSKSGQKQPWLVVVGACFWCSLLRPHDEEGPLKSLLSKKLVSEDRIFRVVKWTDVSGDCEMRWGEMRFWGGGGRWDCEIFWGKLRFWDGLDYVFLGRLGLWDFCEKRDVDLILKNVRFWDGLCNFGEFRIVRFSILRNVRLLDWLDYVFLGNLRLRFLLKWDF